MVQVVTERHAFLDDRSIGYRYARPPSSTRMIRYQIQYLVYPTLGGISHLPRTDQKKKNNDPHFFAWRRDRLCRTRIAQIQPGKRFYYVDHAEYAASTRQHELDHTDQEYICPERSVPSSTRNR